MKRFFKAVFCVFTICAMISLAGCGGEKKDDKGGAGSDTTKSEEPADKK